MNSLMRRTWNATPGVAFGVALVGTWELLAVWGVLNRFVLPSPWAIAMALVQNVGKLASNGAYTAEEALAGFIIGNLAGIGLAVAFVQVDLARRVAYPLALATQAIPVVTIAPALVLWLGHGREPKIFVAAFLVFFPTLVNMTRGLRNAGAGAEELMSTLSARWWQRLWKVRLPASAPYLFTALKLAALSCFIGAIVAEWIGSNRGLGYLIVYDSQQFEIPMLWAGVVVASVLSIVMYHGVAFAERRVVHWQAGVEVAS